MDALKASSRRAHTRLPVELKVRYGQKNAFLHEYTTNISHGGLFIATPVPFETGRLIHFDLEVPGEQEPISLNGEVRWSVLVENEDGETPGMGVRFNFEGNEREKFRQRVHAMVEKQFGPKAAAALAGPPSE